MHRLPDLTAVDSALEHDAKEHSFTCSSHPEKDLNMDLTWHRVCLVSKSFVFPVLASGNHERFFFNIVLLLHFQTNQDFFSNLLLRNYWGF